MRSRRSHPRPARCRWLMGIALVLATSACEPAVRLDDAAASADAANAQDEPDLAARTDDGSAAPRVADDASGGPNRATSTRDDRHATATPPPDTAATHRPDEPGGELRSTLPADLLRLVERLRQAGPLDDEGTTDDPLLRDEADLPAAQTSADRTSGSDWIAAGVPEVFDIDLFEQNLRDALDALEVGYAYSIGRAGVAYAEDGVGDARTDADDPSITQSHTKPMTVASLSKTITTVAVLRLLEAEQIDVDDPIGPWLPSTWARGVGVDDITFAELMTHTSGLGQSYEAETGDTGNGDSRYETMREVFEQDLGSKGPRYLNLNFGIFRLVVPKLLGHDLDEQVGVTLDEEEYDEAAGAIFHAYVQDILASIGVTGGCVNWDPEPATLLYRFPYDGHEGWEPGSYLHRCGGYGFYLSANGLTSFLSHLRYTDALLSPAARTVMFEGRLGLQDRSGAHGTYLGHAGSWQRQADGRGMRGCMLSFSIAVDASILVNYRNDALLSPCTLLRDAFDDAWVPN